MKCEICKEKIQEIFLKKIVGTYIKDVKGKRRAVCFACQQKFPLKEKLLEQL
jgi:hypothetical protein